MNGVMRGEGKQAFTHVITDCKAQTLLPIIKQHVKPGTCIMTDAAKAYWRLEAVADCDYIHRFVIHKENYVKPDDRRVRTQV